MYTPKATPGGAKLQTPVGPPRAGAPAKCACRCMKGDTSALRTSIYFNIVFVGLDPHGPLAAQSHLSVCMEREVRKVALELLEVALARRAVRAVRAEPGLGPL